VIVSYLDSSALLRLCLAEGEVGPVEKALANVPVSSALALVEVPTAISARFHRGDIDPQARDDLLLLGEHILGRVNILQATAEVLAEAVRVAAAHRVRALDAVHLGTAAVAARQQARWGNQLRFCTADRRQASVAAQLFGAGNVDFVEPLS